MIPGRQHTVSIISYQVSSSNKVGMMGRGHQTTKPKRIHPLVAYELFVASCARTAPPPPCQSPAPSIRLYPEYVGCVLVGQMYIHAEPAAGTK